MNGRRALLFAAVLAFAIALLGAPLTARAQQAPDVPPHIEAVASIDPPEAAIGDRVTLIIIAQHADDVLLDAQPPKLDHVDLVSTGTPVTTPRAGGETTTFTWVLQPFLRDAIDTGTLRIGWLRADGSNGTIDVPGATLKINALRAPDDDALRPLKPQATVGGAPPPWVRPAQLAGAIVALCVALWLVDLVWWRRRRHPAVDGPTIDTTPERMARQQLDALAAEAHPRGGDYPTYYGGMALAVRTYLGARFGFNAHALTTHELEQRMVSHGVDRWQARLVGGLLERCDAAVFARRYPDPASADHDLTVAYEIVELSRPRTPTEAEAAAT